MEYIAVFNIRNRLREEQRASFISTEVHYPQEMLVPARFLLIWLTTIVCVDASFGDQNPWYQSCRYSCIKKACEGWGNSSDFASVASNIRYLPANEAEQSSRSVGSDSEDDVVNRNRQLRVLEAGLEESGDDTKSETGEDTSRASRSHSRRTGQVSRVYSPPWNLQLLGWDCKAECEYTCMTKHVEMTILHGYRVQQYHGKWPFRRVWGIQELFASLFSAANGLPHLYHCIYSQGAYNPPGNYMRRWMTLYPWVGMSTWLWSTVFHARDVKWTEAADYFCALLNIFYALWIVILRVSGNPRTRTRLGRVLIPVVGLVLLVIYVRHVAYMWLVKFDYGYNMKVALTAGLLHSLLWLRYQFRARERAYARRGALVVILLNAALLLEVNDFPPVFYRLLDAHAIWHMSTVPLGFAWYEFLIQDAKQGIAALESKGV